MSSNRVLAVVEAFIGVTGVAGGAGLALAPDGSILQMDRALLASSPFADFLVPGILLATFVGGGGLLAAVAAWRRSAFWQQLGLVYAFGLLTFVVVEYFMIGFNWLQAFEAVLALLMLGLVAGSQRAEAVAGAHR